MRSLLFVLFFFHISCSFAAEYTVGIVPQFEVRKIHTIWKPILDELSKQTGHTFKLVGAKTIPSFEKAFLQGEYDFAYMNPYHALIANRAQGYRPIFRDDSTQLKGILVVRKDSGIETISELEGADIAFPSPNALGASLLMRAELKQLYGINIHPIYVDTHTSVYLNVALNKTKAGGGVARSLAEQSPEVKTLLKTIYETRPMNPHPMMVHPRVKKDLAEKVAQLIINMAQQPETQTLLDKIPMHHPIPASMNDYLPMLDWHLEEFYVGE